MEALDELVAHLNGRSSPASESRANNKSLEDQPPQYAMVTVQTHRAVSNAIAQKLGVRHETPQALLVKSGRVVWSASHCKYSKRHA